MNAMKSRFRKCCAGRPRRKAVGDGPRGRRDTRVAHEEFLDRRQSPATPERWPHRLTASTKPIGKTHSTLIQCWPILILGTTPACGGNQSFSGQRTVAVGPPRNIHQVSTANLELAFPLDDLIGEGTYVLDLVYAPIAPTLGEMVPSGGRHLRGRSPGAPVPGRGELRTVVGAPPPNPPGRDAGERVACDRPRRTGPAQSPS